MLTLKEVKAMPVIRRTHASNVIVEEGIRRVSVSRMTVADGMPYDNQVIVEICIGGQWYVVAQYEAK